MTCKIKSCSCTQCKRGRHLYRKQVERQARRKWNRLTATKALNAQSTHPTPTKPFTHHGGGYTD